MGNADPKHRSVYIQQKSKMLTVIFIWCCCCRGLQSVLFTRTISHGSVPRPQSLFREGMNRCCTGVLQRILQCSGVFQGADVENRSAVRLLLCRKLSLCHSPFASDLCCMGLIRAHLSVSKHKHCLFYWNFQQRQWPITQRRLA